MARAPAQRSASALSFSSPPSAQTNPALSQSFDQRSVAATKSQQRPQQPAENSPNALRSSVDAAINNVDRALSEMHKQEVDRLKARIEVHSSPSTFLLMFSHCAVAMALGMNTAKFQSEDMEMRSRSATQDTDGAWVAGCGARARERRAGATGLQVPLP